MLAEKAALGKVTFSDSNHITKNYNIEGTRPVQCIECHHVEQPESEAKKVVPHLTAYPPNRTTTLTAELLAKEPNTKDPYQLLKTASLISRGAGEIDWLIGRLIVGRIVMNGSRMDVNISTVAR